MIDATGWCEQGKHEKCSGSLLYGKGYHWWCACPCHPEPPTRPASNFVTAKDVWRKAREANAA